MDDKAGGSGGAFVWVHKLVNFQWFKDVAAELHLWEHDFLSLYNPFPLINPLIVHLKIY